MSVFSLSATSRLRLQNCFSYLKTLGNSELLRQKEKYLGV